MPHQHRIAVGGIRHETNTFSPIWTDDDDFHLVQGADLLRGLSKVADEADIELLPTFVANAMPGGLVHQETYLRLKRNLLHELESALPYDALLLDLHGAMEVEAIGDAESDLLTDIRALIGPDILIAVSLDLHGNISPRLVEQANILTAFRTAPHRDYEVTRQRALQLLAQALHKHHKPISILVKLPLLLSGEAAVTDREPAQSLYARLDQIDQMPGVMSASLLIGCAWTDSPYTSVSIIITATAEQARDLSWQQAIALAHDVWSRRHEFTLGAEATSIDEAIRLASATEERPVFISDSGDNVTAGAAGDIPLFAERLLTARTQEALVAGLCDAEAVQQCIEAGEGATISLSIGGKMDRRHGRPLLVTGQVIRLISPPDDQSKQPTLAVFVVDGVTLILAVDRRPFTTRASIAATGIDPMAQKIVVVKQGYLFPDLADHAPRSILALSPGTCTLKLTDLPYQKLPRPIYPLDEKDADFTEIL